jgi:protein-L-isoaspartate(D-aspartate) O-methyltransferase
MSEDAYRQARTAMVERQLRARGIRDERVLAAMEAVPRERFVDAGMENMAYEDGPLPIGCEQTISQPYVVAMMLELAEMQPDDRVLEVGAGSGYVAALLGHLAREVWAVERHRSLAETAEERVRALGADNVHVVSADGTKGLPDQAPFDAIIVSAGAPRIPDALREQLNVGGRLVVPQGGRGFQVLLRLEKRADGSFAESEHGGVAFVPLTPD